MTAFVGGLVDGGTRHVGHIDYGQREPNVVLAYRVHAVPRLADGHRDKRYLLSKREQHRLEQQREATY